MKNPLEVLISTVAPHRCVTCGFSGSLICGSCEVEAFIHPPSRCYRCHKATPQSRVCETCRRYSGLSHVWVASEYQEISKQLIYKLKFKRAQAAAKTLASAIDGQLPDLPSTLIVTNVPTANKRVRMRGYDQAKLIAKELASLRGWQYMETLERLGSTRQVGAKREDRLIQLKHSFKPLPAKLRLLEDTHILLVDDVLTTGATLGAASKELRRAGARIIDGAVFTQPID